jgi:HEAT repeat protein
MNLKEKIQLLARERQAERREKEADRIMENFNRLDRPGKEKAMRQLAKMEAVGQLIAILGHPDPYLRGQVARMLEHVKNPRATEGLAVALQDVEAGVRVNAANSLQYRGDTAAIPQLERSLQDPEKGVRTRVLVALGNIKDERVVPILKKALHDPDRDVRTRAELSLEHWGK